MGCRIFRVPNSPYEGLYLSDITLERFSHAHEIDPCTDAIRPDGGDYFSTLTLHFSGDKAISIRGEEAFMDGYMNVVLEDSDNQIGD